jgi:hypothetical protein
MGVSCLNTVTEVILVLIKFAENVDGTCSTT